MKRAWLLVAALLLIEPLIVSCSREAEPSKVTEEDYAIYSKVIEHIITKNDNKIEFIIIEKEIFPIPESSSELKKKRPDLYKRYQNCGLEYWGDENQQSVNLESNFTLNIGYALEASDVVLKRKVSFPKTVHLDKLELIIILGFTKVTYNRQHDIAMLFYSSSNYITRGIATVTVGLILLKKQNGKWIVTEDEYGWVGP